MTKASPKNFLNITPLKIGFILAFLMCGLAKFQPEFLNVLEMRLLDQRFLNRGFKEPGPEVVIGVIDEKSQDILGRWPWPRAVLAKLVDQLAKNGAATIGFDMVFSERGDAGRQQAIKLIGGSKKTDEKTRRALLKEVEAVQTSDEIFAEALKRAGNTVLGIFFHDHIEDVAHLQSKEIKFGLKQIEPSRYKNFQIRQEADLKRLPNKIAVESNLPLFNEASEGWGYFNLTPDPDGIMRHYQFVSRAGHHFYPPLLLKVVEHYMQSELHFTLGRDGIENVGIGEEIPSIPVSRRGEFLVNYYGPSKTFPHIPVVDIIQGKVKKEMLEDRIVLIGATGKGIFDLRATPFEQVYPGVEINATIIDNILQANYLVKPKWYQFNMFVLVVCIGVGLAWILSMAKAVTGFLISALFLLIYYLIGQQFFNKGVLINLTYPCLQIFATYTTVTVFSYLSESRQKQFINNAFSQYLSPTVVKRLVDDPDRLKLGGELKRMTAFFSDVAKFSTISESLTPTQLTDLLNEYLSPMTDIVLKYEGTIDKYEGDAIIAFFGAPLDYPDHATRGCLVAIEMQKTLAEMRKRWAEEGRAQLKVRIGLNTGVMTVGNMGSNFRMDYSILGDSVNLASRLEGVNKVYGTDILISQFTYDDIQESIEVRELDKIRVVGKVQPVSIYEVLDRKGEVGDEMMRVVGCFASGLELYRQRRWDDALDAFNQALKIRPEDAPSKTFVQRCLEFRNGGSGLIPEDWDGVYQMTSK